MTGTIFASRSLWSPKKLNNACRKHGVHLSDPGEVILAGGVVGSYQWAGGCLVVRDIAHDSPLAAAFDLRQVE